MEGYKIVPTEICKSREGETSDTDIGTETETDRRRKSLVDHEQSHIKDTVALFMIYQTFPSSICFCLLPSMDGITF